MNPARNPKQKARAGRWSVTDSFCLLLVVYCLYANTLSLISGSVEVLYLRDAAAIALALILFAKFGKVTQLALFVLWICMISGYTVAYHGSYGSLSKIRNYAMFPLVVFCFAEFVRPITLSSREYESVNQKIFNFAFNIYVVLVFAEGAAYFFIPHLQGALFELLSEISTKKGTGVGLSGGLFSGLRAITPAGNPVQGAFVVFVWWLSRLSRRRAVVFLVSHLLTFSKITLALFFLKPITTSRNAIILVMVFYVSVLVSYFVIPSELNVHFDSARLHIAGLVSGLYSMLTSPLGIPFESVSAQSGQSWSVVPPGFESFFGSICASFGLLGCVFSLFIFATACKRSQLVLLLFFAFSFSDNVASPHLFAPVFYCVYIRLSCERRSGNFRMNDLSCNRPNLNLGIIR